MSPTTALVLYTVLILLASLAGGLVPFVVKLTHKRMELAISFVAGVMLGVGLLHMLPHAFLARVEAALRDNTGSSGGASEHELMHRLLDPLLLWLLAGFLVMFFIERFFCFHHHDVPANSNQGALAVAAPAHHRHKLTWTGATVGLSLHSLIEGVALAASIHVSMLAGLGVFLVIFLHKPFDSLTIGTLMSVGQRSSGSRHLVNLAFSLLVPAGVLLFYVGVMRQDDGKLLVSSALAFSAGTFLCIAMSDLLPELQFHQHDRGKLSAALLIGLALAWGIGVMEARMHDHDHGNTHPEHVHDNGHDHDHDHDHDH